MSITLHTTHGPLKLELHCQETPKTSFNFLALCASGYYNNCLFHKSAPSFLIQGGDPTGTSKGGESIYGGYFEDEFSPDLRHDCRGTLSMANKNKPNTNQSQFFILYSNSQPQLDNLFTVFGRVIDGMDSLDRMEKVKIGKKNRPLEEIKILRVTIHSNPFADGLIDFEQVKRKSSS